MKIRRDKKYIDADNVIEHFEKISKLVNEKFKPGIQDVIDILKSESRVNVLELNKEYPSDFFVIETRWDDDKQFFTIRRR